MRRQECDIALNGRLQPIAFVDRPGDDPPVLFIHGLGNSSANFEELLIAPALQTVRLVALDFPGCGMSPYPPTGTVEIDDLVVVVEGLVERLHLPPALLVGASMGGLVAMLYAERNPGRTLGLLNVEGNLAPEDCMFSRLVVPHSYEEFSRITFPEILESLRTRPGRGFAMHLDVLRRADPRAYYHYSFQTVSYSDHGDLLSRFLALPMYKHFVYGEANRGLSYLPQLRGSGCAVTEIAGADHFLFYDAPDVFAHCVLGARREASSTTRR